MKIIFLLLSLSLPALALDITVLSEAAKKEQATQESLNILFEASFKYLESHATEAENADWMKKWVERVKQADREEEPEDKLTLRVLQTFVEDNHELLKEPERIDQKILIQACRLFCLCMKKNFSLPSRITCRLTPELAGKVSAFLKEH